MMKSASHFTGMQSNRSMPDASVIPVLHYRNVADAAAWLCRVFGFSERLRIGGHRVQMQAGSGAIVIAQGVPPCESGAQPASAIMVRVKNADALCAACRAAGAKVLGDPVSFPYGERQFSVLDIGGHAWTFSQSEADVDPAQWGGELIPASPASAESSSGAA